MSSNNLWVLPDGVNEITSELAAPLEKLRREILDKFSTWGYDLVFPPLIEFLDSILIGSGTKLDLQTFKLTDQLSGRLMGVRADMTPQVARIDAHVRHKNEPDRLCYLGPVLRAKTHGVDTSRTPIQLGAELFGHNGMASDIEIVRLMLEVLKIAKVDKLCLDIGHVGIFRAIISEANLGEANENNIRDILQRKASGELEILLSSLKVDEKISRMLLALPHLYGGAEIFQMARDTFGNDFPAIEAALLEMEALAQAINQDNEISLNFDLAELRGYSYHTGLVFAAYVDGKGAAIAKGGRYDAIGKSFGRARPATGFSADLVALVRLSGIKYTKQAIFAPLADKNSEMENFIQTLRHAGEIVVCELPEQVGGAASMGCNREIILQDNQWQVKNII